MKVLIISENKEKTDALINAVKISENEIIHYKWFMKALDNIEEVSPEIIIINAEDFPRHWKVLCQYTLSSLFSKNVKVILFVPKDFSEEDLEKSKALKVSGILRDENKTPRQLQEDFISIIKNVPQKNTTQGETEIMDDSFSLYTVDNLIDNDTPCEDALYSVDNLFENQPVTEAAADKTSLFTVDNLLKTDSDYDFPLYNVDNLIVLNDELYTVDNLLDGMEEYEEFGEDIVIEDYDEAPAEEYVEELSEVSSEELSEECTEELIEVTATESVSDSVMAGAYGTVEETFEESINETTASMEEEILLEDEIPTVSAIIGSKNPDEEVTQKDPALLHEIQNVFSANLQRRITEEDIQNEYSIYSVDNLFGLEENDYSISSVDNLFYSEASLEEKLPKTQSECKELVGSLLKRILKYYEN